MSWERAARDSIAQALGAPPAATITAHPSMTLDPSEQLASLVVSFVGQTVAPAERATLLAAAARALAPDGRLVVVDHNRPRRLPAALGALIAPPRVPGWTPR